MNRDTVLAWINIGDKWVLDIFEKGMTYRRLISLYPNVQAVENINEDGDYARAEYENGMIERHNRYTLIRAEELTDGF